jgi:hypothetical protein
MARRCPVMRLKRVDFPTLGLPTMTTVGMALDMIFHDSRRGKGGISAVPTDRRTFWVGSGFRHRTAKSPKRLSTRAELDVLYCGGGFGPTATSAAMPGPQVMLIMG